MGINKMLWIAATVLIIGLGTWIKILQNQKDELKAAAIKVQLDLVDEKIAAEKKTRAAVIDSMKAAAIASNIKADEIYDKMPKKRKVPVVPQDDKINYLKNLK